MGNEYFCGTIGGSQACSGPWVDQEYETGRCAVWQGGVKNLIALSWRTISFVYILPQTYPPLWVPSVGLMGLR